MSTYKMRSEFEKFQLSKYHPSVLEFIDGRYVRGVVNDEFAMYYHGWQAALSQSEPAQVIQPVDEDKYSFLHEDANDGRSIFVCPPTQASKEYFQFLTDVMTAAGLVSHGKKCKALGERLGIGCMTFRTYAKPISISQPDYEAPKADYYTVKQDNLIAHDHATRLSIESEALKENTKLLDDMLSKVIEERNNAEQSMCKLKAENEALKAENVRLQSECDRSNLRVLELETVARDSLSALIYHSGQTRPIERTEDNIKAIRKTLWEN